MKSVLQITVVACGFLFPANTGLCQQATPNVAGIWQFTIGTLSTTIQITQTGAAIEGQFTPVADLTPAFTSTIGSSLGVVLKWDTSRTDIPAVGIYYYSGLVSADGTAMQGTYGASPSQSVGSWSGTRLAGLGPAIAGVINAASGGTGPVAPGEIISIFANVNTNPIGPTNGTGLQLDQSGGVATALGGVQVHFVPINVYAPLTFTSAGQINAVVPYEVAGLSTVMAEIQYLGQTSAPVVLQVGPTAPAIFTANGSGVGPGAILNHDGITVNGPNTQEPRGGAVVLFVTGEGQTSPPGVSGKVTTVAAIPPLTPAPLASIAVRINGQSAPITFAGEAPGLVSGVLQLNVQIPTTISPGNVAIQVIIGGTASQNGVTVSVQ